MIPIFAIIITFGIVMCLLAYFIYHLAKAGAKLEDRFFDLEAKHNNLEINICNLVRDFFELNTKYNNLAYTLEQAMNKLKDLELHTNILMCRADATSDFMLKWIPKLETLDKKHNKKRKARK